MKRFEDEIIDERNQKIELAKNNETLRMIIKEKDFAIEKSLNNNQDQDGRFTVLKSQFEDKNLMIEGMIVKMDLMKKALDEVNYKYLEA